MRNCCLFLTTTDTIQAPSPRIKLQTFKKQNQSPAKSKVQSPKSEVRGPRSQVPGPRSQVHTLSDCSWTHFFFRANFFVLFFFFFFFCDCHKKMRWYFYLHTNLLLLVRFLSFLAFKPSIIFFYYSFPYYNKNFVKICDRTKWNSFLNNTESREKFFQLLSGILFYILNLLLGSS